MLLDTTFLIDLQKELAGRGRSGAMAFLSTHAQETAHITLVTWMEFAEGFPDEKAELCRAFLRRFRLVAPTRTTAWQASRISRQLRKAGKSIGDHDIWIAATALEHLMPLVTRNTRHFSRVLGLKVVNY